MIGQLHGLAGGERFKRLRGVAPDALETFQRCLTAFAQNLDHIAYGEAL